MQSFKNTLLLAVPCLIAFTGCGASDLSPINPKPELGVYQESLDGNVELKTLGSEGRIVVLKGSATESKALPHARDVKLDGSKCSSLIFVPQDVAAFRPHRLEIAPGAENCESLNLPLRWVRG